MALDRSAGAFNRTVLALGSDILEDRQFELECLAAALPRFASMLLCPEGDSDAFDIPTPRSYAEAISGEYFSQWQTAMDAEMPSLKSTGTYRDYELHSLDFSTAFLQGSLHEEIWLRRPHGFTSSFSEGTQWSLRRAVYGLRQAPREWHDTVMTTLAALGFAPSTADPALFLRTDTSIPPFYVVVYVDDLVFATADTVAPAPEKAELQERHICTDLGELMSYLGLQFTQDCVLQRFGFQFSSPQATPLPAGHSLSAPPSDESVEPSGPYPELVGCLMYVATWLPIDTGRRFLGRRSSDSAFVTGLHLQSRLWFCLVEELRWLIYLLIDLGERPRSPPVLYVDNKAMIAFCHKQRLEHKTKHIALRYFLARELQQRGQFRLSYVATRANTADVFTKALGSGDHQRFCTALGLLPTLPNLLVA
ncbi:unnamed protein product [Closterium sp. NIES-53]